MSEKNQENETNSTYPLIPLRDVVVFPHMVIPLFVGRAKSNKALEVAMEAGKHVMLVAQKTATKDDPDASDLYQVGSIANILQMLKLPDGTVKVLVEGVNRARVEHVLDEETHLSCEIKVIESTTTGDASKLKGMRRALVTQFEQYVKVNKKIPPEILTSLAGVDEAGRLADTVAAHLPLKIGQKQEVLELADVKTRLEHLLALLESELDIMQV